MKYQLTQLEAMTKEELQATYQEVIGSAPDGRTNTANLIKSITDAQADLPDEEPITTEQSQTEVIGSAPDDVASALPIETTAPVTSTASEDNSSDSQPSKETTIPEVKAPTVKAPSVPDGHVLLIDKTTKETLSMPKEAWNNLPKGHRAKFDVSAPSEVTNLLTKKD